MHDFQTRRQKSLCESFANRNDLSARGHRVVALKKKVKLSLAREQKKTRKGGGRAPALSARSSRVGCPFPR